MTVEESRLPFGNFTDNGLSQAARQLSEIGHANALEDIAAAAFIREGNDAMSQLALDCMSTAFTIRERKELEQ